jgi:hypothetical protein
MERPSGSGLEQRAASEANAGSERYAAAANGILTTEALSRACGHVWRDSNSVIMLGPDILNSEPVSYDDKQALTALKRHIAAAGRRAFMEDVLPKLGFGPGDHQKQDMKQPEDGKHVPDKFICVKCGGDGEPLHLGCRLCEECCDCRPAGT